MDETQWVKVFAAGMVQPFIEIEKDDTLRLFGEAPLITDAKSLIDSAKSVSSGLRLAEKRTAIEVAIVRERMEAMAGYWRWVNSAQQLADGLTKPSARNNFVLQLKRGVHQLKYDPSYTAAKKVTKDDSSLDKRSCLKKRRTRNQANVVCRAVRRMWRSSTARKRSIAVDATTTSISIARAP